MLIVQDNLLVLANQHFTQEEYLKQGYMQLIHNLIDFSVGTLPFYYLGVPIFKGKPKKIHLHPIADKVEKTKKLSTWKAFLLSIDGRAQLVKDFVQEMMMYSMQIYSWPISLVKYLER